MRESNIGILAADYYIPETFETAKEAVEKYGASKEKIKHNGFKKVHVAETETLADMAYEACMKTIKRADIDPLEIDLLIYARAGIPDNFWHPEYAKLQDRIGAKNAYSYAVDQSCNAQMVALDIALGKLSSDERMDTVLIVSSDKTQLPFINRWTSAGSLAFCDGASAGIIRKGINKNKIFKLKFKTDGRFAEMQKLKIGYNMPIQDNIPIDWFKIDLHQLAVEVLTPENEDLKERVEWYRKVMKDGSKKIMEELLNDCNMKKSDVDFLLAYNYNKPAMKEFGASLDLPIDKTNWYISEDYGHLGPADIFFNFTKLIDDVKIKSGDKLAVFSAGSGYSWSSGILEI